MKLVSWFFSTFGEQNIYAAIIGWVIFTLVVLSMYKDENEKTWNFWAYMKEHWDNWIASLAVAFGLLYVGKNNLSIPNVDGSHIEWSNLYYLASGFAYELLIKLIKKFKGQ